MKVVITGSNGFIGTNLTLHLKNTFERAELLGIDSQIANSQNSIITKELIQTSSMNLADIDNDPSVLRGVDVVIHLAAKGNVVESVDDPIDNFNNNVISTIKLLSALKKENVKNIIFSSTGGALMGNTPPPVDESSIPMPISPYGASKLACEGYIRAFTQSYDMNAIIFRFGNVYGPHSRHKKGVINSWFNNIEMNKPIIIYGDGTSSRDYIHVNDICHGISQGLSVIRDGFLSKKCSVYHLANKQETSLNDLAEMIANITDKKLEIIYKGDRKGEVGKNFADSSLARKEIGFAPQVSIMDGLRDMYAWIRNEQ